MKKKKSCPFPFVPYQNLTSINLKYGSLKRKRSCIFILTFFLIFIFFTWNIFFFFARPHQENESPNARVVGTKEISKDINPNRLWKFHLKVTNTRKSPPPHPQTFFFLFIFKTVDCITLSLVQIVQIKLVTLLKSYIRLIEREF